MLWLLPSLLGPVSTLTVALDAETIEALADAVAARVRQDRHGEPPPAGWLDARAAARYLGWSSTSPLHKLTAARVIPFSREAPGGKCWFRASDLDAYRERGLIEPPSR